MIEEHYVLPKGILFRHLPNTLKSFLEKDSHDSNMYKLKPMDLYKYTNANMEDQASALGLKIFDPALPLNVVKDIRKLTGQEIAGHAVYSYDFNRHGDLVPITKQGEIIIQIYDHVRDLLDKK